ncbi:hypothetical protein K7X08_014878 [Anisodus acutangulus]|uniref:Uncharacterized protein n=1 Tax=Anisodus acutangulus TaxID=402998 RepID=A0A9Q1LJC5_9SOLA|nr:hypothetical protein K7X08_014878 [Anisodus acutangulus]
MSLEFCDLGPFESYYLNWYDGSYGDGGPYGEPLPSNQDKLYEDNSFWANEEEEDNHFSRNTLYRNELLLPYNGGMNNWLVEFESYFAVPSYVNGSEKSDDQFEGEVIKHGSHYADHSQAVSIGNQWLWQLDAGYKDADYNYHVRQVSEAARADSWDEMRLVESIFGHWPSLLKQDLDDQIEPAVA